MSQPRTQPSGRELSSDPVVLVVEDDDDLRALIVEHLSQLGYPTTDAGDAETALAAYRSRRLRLLITDVHLPGIDGVTLAHELQQLQPLLPVLCISGAMLTVPAGLRADIALLPKPFTLQELTSAVARACGPPEPAVCPSLQRRLG